MSLEQDFQLVFISGTTGVLYIDPSEIVSLFPDAPYEEIFEWIYYFSREVDELIDLKPGDEIPPLVYEYIRAAVACALTRIYDWSGGGDEAAFRLGDLSVEARFNNRDVVSRADASNWCELAAMLRSELLGTEGRMTMRGVVRGSSWSNPMPPRHLRHIEYN